VLLAHPGSITPSSIGDPASIAQGDEVGGGGVIRGTLSRAVRSKPSAVTTEEWQATASRIAFRLTPDFYGSGLSYGTGGSGALPGRKPRVGGVTIIDFRTDPVTARRHRVVSLVTLTDIQDIVWADDETGCYGVKGRDAKGKLMVWADQDCHREEATKPIATCRTFGGPYSRPRVRRAGSVADRYSPPSTTILAENLPLERGVSAAGRRRHCEC